MPAPHHSVFLQSGCPSCHPTNSIKALKAMNVEKQITEKTLTQQNKGKMLLQQTNEHRTSRTTRNT